MNCKVFSFISAKGGTGKTILAASIATLLGGLGKKVLIIDLDAATNGLTLLYLKELSDVKNLQKNDTKELLGIFECYGSKLPSIININQGIDIIPSAYVMKQLEELTNRNTASTLSKTLNNYRRKYDFIFLDSQAGSDIYTKIAIESADENIIVSEFDPLSLAGVDRLKRFFPDSLSYDKTWILFNKVLPDIAESISDNFYIAKYLSPIPWYAEVIRSIVQRKLAIDTEKGNSYTLALLNTIQSLLGDIIESDINLWKKDKEETLRTPIFDQLNDIRNELHNAQKARITTIYEMRALEKKPRNFLYSFLAGVIAVITTISLIISVTQFYSSYYILLWGFLTVLLSGSIGYFLSKIQERRITQDLPAYDGQLSVLNSLITDLQTKAQELETLTQSSFEDIIKRK